MKRYVNRRGVLVFVLVAAVLMIAADLFVLYGLPHQQTDDEVYMLPVVDSNIFVHSEIADFEASQEMTGWKDLNVPEPEAEKYTVIQPPVIPETYPVIQPKPQPEIAEALPKPAPEPEPFIRHEGEPAKIVIIIDDMGMDRKRSRRAVELPGPLTLAFLPYAPKLDELIEAAKANGHELIIHMPMEPLDSKLDPGPIALRSGMDETAIVEMLDKAFASFKGYDGINNHMGSKLTKDTEAMRVVMRELKKRGLFFVDSKTIGSSVASGVAREAGIPYADRDVFLDHQDTPEFVRKSLGQLERIASKKGYAIAIGHPKDSTLNALKDWLPTLKERGFELVPVGEVVHRPSKQLAPGVSFEEEPVTTLEPSSGISYGPVQPPSPPPAEPPAPY